MRILKGILIIGVIFLIGCSLEPSKLMPVVNNIAPERGKVGDRIVIRGYNFGKNSAVDFNGTQVAVIVQIPGAATEDQIIVMVPAGAATGKIKVTSGNLSALSTNDFIVL